ncbi:MAG: hypothetical protein ABIJ56_03920 [Pseudomonadota bacterium]
MSTTIKRFLTLCSLAVFCAALWACGSATRKTSDDADGEALPDLTDTMDGVEAVDIPADGSDGADCVDNDGDGRGPGCPEGLDCDDDDPLHWNDCPDCAATHAPGCPCLPGESYACYEGPAETRMVGACVDGTRFCEEGFLGDCVGQQLPSSIESCGNDLDDDCNGAGDEEVYGPCGDCDTTCRSEGDVIPDPDDPHSDGVVDNPDGPGIVLGSSEIDAGFAWIANAGEGTVSKLRLTDGVEVGRYRVGKWGTSDDQPSRTAVDSLGNAYVANRAHVSANNQASVTKLAGDLSFCTDRNGNGSYETSTGPTPLPLGEDECVIWTVDVGNPGGCARALAIDFGDPEDPLTPGNPWVGLWSEMRFLKMDPEDGHVLDEVAIDVNPYGAAIDGDGWIWISGMNPAPGYIQRFSTVTGEVQAAISTSGTGCGHDSGPYSPYGICVDTENRVWVGSWSAHVCRYNPSDGTWLAVNVNLDVARGVAADRSGYVWASNYGGGGNWIHGIQMDTGAIDFTYSIAGSAPIGVGVDQLDQVWTVNQGSETATRLVKATEVLTETPVGTSPYTYSDFTGYQRSIMMDEGRWYHAFHRCNNKPEDRWGELTWDVDTPSDSTVTIFGYSAETEDALLTMDPVRLALIAPDAPPADITAIFADAGVPLYEWLGILVVLRPSSDLLSPVVRAVEVKWHCHELG